MDAVQNAPRILLIDDNDDARNVAMASLRDGGLDVVDAADGDEAIALLLAESIDLVVLDPLVAGHGGSSVWDWLASRAGPRLPVIVWSAADALTVGDATVVAKSASPPELLEAILVTLDVVQ